MSSKCERASPTAPDPTPGARPLPRIGTALRGEWDGAGHSAILPPMLEQLMGYPVVLTGLVTVSMETLYLGDRAALVVLLGYSGAVCAIAWFTRGRRLKL